MKVFITDLRHDYQGVLSTDVMPLGIGYMKSYMMHTNPDFDIKLFAYPSDIIEVIENSIPDVLLMSNYMWNEQINLFIAKKIKQKSPNTLVIFGGPNYPLETKYQEEYLNENTQIDLYITGEGDFYATELVEKFIESELNISIFLQSHFHSAFYFQSGVHFISTNKVARSRDLDLIPSPWLNGVMDQFFDGKLSPLFETNRGCPFSCTFCVQGQKWYTKVSYFSIDRIKAELLYIGNIIQKRKLGVFLLYIADSNFGMFERDIEVSEAILETRKKYDWPNVIDATTGKNQPERILEAIEKLNGMLVFYQAAQSMNETVLENIKRKNISLDAYKKIQIFVKSRGLRSNSDLILGLPEETKYSHIQSLKALVECETDNITNFQAVLLKGSELATEASREKFHIKSKYRLLPKCYGIYDNELVIESEEIISSTSTLSFDDYLESRIYHFIISVFWNSGRFELFFKILKKHKISSWVLIENIKNKISTSVISHLLKDYLEETKNELFDNHNELIKYYNTPTNIDLLNKSLIGDNLIYKYKGISNFYFWKESTDFFYEVFSKTISDNHIQNIKGFLSITEELKTYVFNMYTHGKNENQFLKDSVFELKYDVKKWIDDQCPDKTSEYLLKKNKTYHFVINENIKKKFKKIFQINSFDLRYIPIFVKRINIDWMRKKML